MVLSPCDLYHNCYFQCRTYRLVWRPVSPRSIHRKSGLFRPLVRVDLYLWVVLEDFHLLDVWLEMCWYPAVCNWDLLATLWFGQVWHKGSSFFLKREFDICLNCEFLSSTLLVWAERWHEMNSIRIPLKLILIPTAPFFLLINPPHPPTPYLSTFSSFVSNPEFFGPNTYSCTDCMVAFPSRMWDSSPKV